MAVTKKSDETRKHILQAALRVFKQRGFEGATMREVAAEAEMAVGAAYYHFSSKDAIVVAFYEQAQEEMRPALDEVLRRSRTLEQRLRGIVSEKLRYFAGSRELLGALSSHADPKHPLSPFSAETAGIRENDQSYFERAVELSKVRLPREVDAYLPRLLWLYQMGILLFWVYDASEGQKRTEMLLDRTLKMLTVTLKLAGLPLLRPLHRLAGELLRTVYGD